MSTIFARPESALKRAEELIHVGQKQAALQALHDLITSKRCRSWQKPLEKVMMRYVELCVDLRKGRFAKDGLIQYSRIVCQQQINNVTSLEEVVKHFMHLSNKKAEEAAMNRQAEALDVHDLEAPEDLMLSYVSGKDPSDTSWLKFLWETYRTVLEVLRNNSKLEALYAMAAHKAFQFCKQYKRSTEFRRLCEMIRNHLTNLNKSRDRPDLTAPESCQLYLDTRVEQLKIAAELSLSQEAFRSVEDIHGLLSMVQRTPKPSVLAVYYAKLTEIFWTSESHYLYHAYAWLELFNLHKSHNKNLTRKDAQLLASSALLAALSVTPYDDHNKYGASHLELENEKERSLRMANLVNFSIDSKRKNREKVSRASLLSELAARGVISFASQEVQELYNLVEHEFLPLDLASKVQPLLSKISTIGGKLSAAPSVPEIQLSQYQPALQKLTTLRVLQQASRVFQSMRIDTLSRMIPFFDFNVVEKIAVDAVKHKFIAMKVDHISGAVRFGNTKIESDVLSTSHLIGVLADSLNKASSLPHPAVHKTSKLDEKPISLAGVVEKEHQRLLARKSFIEKRKEDDERQILEKGKAEEAKRWSIQKKSADEERERLLKERRLREQQRIRREIEDREIEEARQNVTKQGAMDTRTRQGMEKRLEKLAKTMDHLERARRQEEAPLMEEAFRKRVEEEKVLHEQEQLRETELSEQRHAGDWLVKKRLSRLLEHKNAFQERVVQRRDAEFLSLRKEREERISQLVSSRKRERETARKVTYYLRMEGQRIQRPREEEEQRIQRAREEEEERKRREEASPARSNQPWRRKSGLSANSSSSTSWRH